MWNPQLFKCWQQFKTFSSTTPTKIVSLHKLYPQVQFCPQPTSPQHAAKTFAFLSATNLLCCESFHWTYALRIAIGLFAFGASSVIQRSWQIHWSAACMATIHATFSIIRVSSSKHALLQAPVFSILQNHAHLFLLQNDAKGQKSVQIYKLEFFLDLFSTMFPTVLLQALFYLLKSKFWLLVMASHIWWEDESMPPRL